MKHRASFLPNVFWGRCGGGAVGYFVCLAWRGRAQIMISYLARVIYRPIETVN